MKHHIERWRKLRDKALSRKQPALSRGRQRPLTRELHTQVLLLALCDFLEHSGLLNASDPKASIFIEAIHDWKESIRNGEI